LAGILGRDMFFVCECKQRNCDGNKFLTQGWAKCDMVQTVSNNRLNKPMLAGRGWLSQCIPSPIITLIQQAIVNSIKISENSIHGTQSI
jgi:uncharacterized protein YifN (PemK superfamily)